MIKLFILTFSFLLLNAQEKIIPIPIFTQYDKEKAELGKKLFFDTRLSKDNTISCSSCHTLPGNGANNTPFSFGVNGAQGGVNSPTVLNSVFNFVQFWDGRAANLTEQAKGPIENPIEMATTIPDVLSKLVKTSYKKEFKKVYKDGLNEKNLLNAIVEFEKALTTPNSRFDQYLRGDDNALNEQEKRGYNEFISDGCISCHNGVNIGGNMYQKSGIFMPFLHKKVSYGRYNVTKRERDKFVFKVPSLRNIELSAPYFHDGSTAKLSDAIKKMRVNQLGVQDEKSKTEDIEAFLKTLTGESPKIMQEINR